MIFKDKKVLIFGLGLLGGGISTAKWFYKKGAKLKITDLKTKKDLQEALSKLKNIKAQYILGKHREKDIDWADIVVVNPAVSYKNKFVLYAREKNKEVVNDCYLFFKYAKGDIIAVTGTRGKTTTTAWIYEFLKLFEKNIKRKILIGGNQPEKSLLKLLDKTKENTISVLELSSFQLEFYEKGLKAPSIAVITCILNDHLNRYKNLKEYATTKARIFLNQSENDFLILNKDNKWYRFFVNLRPKSKIYFISKRRLNAKLNGVYLENNKKIIFQIDKIKKSLAINEFTKLYGEHNLTNLMFALLASFLFLNLKFNIQINIFLKKIKDKLLKLPLPPFRQEVIYNSSKLTIINDSAGTSPDATIAAIKRFIKLNRNLVLITGGTDKNLDFKELAKEIKKSIRSNNLILLQGSATKKLIEELTKIGFVVNKNLIFDDLKNCIKRALEISNNKKSIILFSPGAASFEKFKNEFDRGKKFNKIVKDFFKLGAGGFEPPTFSL